MTVRGRRGIELIEGEVMTLFASAARGASAGTNGADVATYGERARYIFVLDITAAATDVTDTLDVYVDVLNPDLTTYTNAIHFTQALGTGGVKRFHAVLDATNPGTSVIDATSDAAAGAVRPGLFGQAFRGRYVEVDPGAGVSSFTFSLLGYAVGSRV
jgi:hypothetical protein